MLHDWKLLRVTGRSFVLLRLYGRVSRDRRNVRELLGESISAVERAGHSYREMPGYVKIIVIAQAATILSLTLWMYQVYLNDIYFQEYVISLFQTNFIADALLSIVTASVLALGTFTLLGSMGPARRQSKAWRLLSQRAKEPDLSPIPALEAVALPPKRQVRTRRPRQRKPRGDVDKLFNSMRYFADDTEQQ
ncbi:MAG TPA: hypothetical protein VNA15_09855 [Candidatus Angelobacter sp.]|nr:hypothetical protein [Candidatus Angelobacter sp.]